MASVKVAITLEQETLRQRAAYRIHANQRARELIGRLARQDRPVGVRQQALPRRIG
jgi:hypothetical protein